MSLSRLCLIALAASLTFTSARADSLTTGAFYSGDQNNFVSGEISYVFNGSAGVGAAGNITGSTGMIGGKLVGFSQIFCVDLSDDIYLNSTYSATYTSNGTVKGSAVTDAGQIAWLVVNRAPLDSNTAQNEGLQAAIWSLEYSGFSLSASNDPAVIAAFHADLAALGSNSASVGLVDWITPTNSDGSFAQAQVGLAQAPEPSGLMLFGTGIVGIMGVLRRRLRATA